MNLPSVGVCRVAVFVLLAMSVFAVSCKKKAASPEGQAQRQAPVKAEDASIVAAEDEAAAGSVEHKPGTLSLPLEFARHTGDLDEMIKQRRIRALITINPIGFFYVQGRPAGITFEALQELERFLNQKYKTGALKVKVTFIPMRPDQVEAALTEGRGDVI